MDDLKDGYVREFRALIWYQEQLRATQFFAEQYRQQMIRSTAKTAAYKIVLLKLLTRIMRLAG